MTDVLIPAARIVRWVENFRARHGTTRLSATDGALCGVAEDGSTFAARLPFDAVYAGPADPAAFAAAAVTPPDWGVLLVRRGGFAVARLHGAEVVDSKVGRRHVQGRTKAGGWSQQRFARRRANQARAAFEGPLVYGGDEAAMPEEALRLLGHVPDPRRDVLLQAIADAQSARIEVLNAG